MTILEESMTWKRENMCHPLTYHQVRERGERDIEEKIEVGFLRRRFFFFVGREAFTGQVIRDCVRGFF